MAVVTGSRSMSGDIPGSGSGALFDASGNVVGIGRGKTIGTDAHVPAIVITAEDFFKL